MRVLAALHLLLAGVAYAQTCSPADYELINPSTRPATLYCETKGKLLAPAAISTSKATNYQSCIAACRNQTKCVSLGFTQRNTSCTLYSKRLRDMNYTQQSTDYGTTFADTLCYRPAEKVANYNFAKPKGSDQTQAANWTLALSKTDGFKYPYEFDRHKINATNYAIKLNISYTEPQKTQLASANTSQTLSCLTAGASYQLSLNFTGFGHIIEAYLGSTHIFSNDCPPPNYYCGNTTYTIPPVVAPSTSALLNIVVRIYDYTISELDFVSLKRVP